MDIDLHVEEGVRVEDNIYPLLAKFNGNQVWLVVSGTQGVLLYDSQGYGEIGYFSNFLDFGEDSRNWEILPPGSSVTFLQE
ncbi:hypothetical protein [Marinicella marina]|uniref:hypothetical protein n=1 Tax=Marinicella marina TaxID=2996016 RepID=UPI0024BC3D51|nr:hypothetical protein [Marinicella marina]MDJ1139649.1 hypothetical protein [Marinicella marina]